MKDNQTTAGPQANAAGAFGEIPKRLREYYDSLQEETIPDRFLDLLEKLDQAEKAANQADSLKEFE